jgi:hypothetical protein
MIALHRTETVIKDCQEEYMALSSHLGSTLLEKARATAPPSPEQLVVPLQLRHFWRTEVRAGFQQRLRLLPQVIVRLTSNDFLEIRREGSDLGQQARLHA